jgi:internalin A
MDNLWDEVEDALRQYAPRAYAGLRPPASQEAIAEVEKELGVSLPADVKQAYLRHDGSSDPHSIFVGLCWWCSLEDLLQNWRMLVKFSKSDRERNPDNYPAPQAWWGDLKVQPVFWSPRWIPIGLSGTSSRIYVDLDPAPKGVAGQLISDAGMQDPKWMAPSFSDYLACLTEHLKSGRLSEAPDGPWAPKSPGKPIWWTDFSWTLQR